MYLHSEVGSYTFLGVFSLVIGFPVPGGVELRSRVAVPGEPGLASRSSRVIGRLLRVTVVLKYQKTWYKSTIMIC